MTGMVVHPGHTLNHQRHPRQRPEIRSEAVPPRTLPEHLLHLAELSSSELWLASRPPGGVEGANAAALPPRLPPADALAAHLQLTRNRGPNHLAGGKQAARLFAPAFEFLKIATGTNRRTHASSIGDDASSVTIFCEFVTVLCEIQYIPRS